VRRSHWIIALFGVCVVISLIVLPGDDPKTPYNESDTPISLATPVRINTAPSIQLILPVARSIMLFRDQLVCGDDGAMMHSGMAAWGMVVSHTCLNFLCVLLC
jgi:hypothetical protein